MVFAKVQRYPQNWVCRQIIPEKNPKNLSNHIKPRSGSYRTNIWRRKKTSSQPTPYSTSGQDHHHRSQPQRRGGRPRGAQHALAPILNEHLTSETTSGRISSPPPSLTAPFLIPSTLNSLRVNPDSCQSNQRTRTRTGIRMLHTFYKNRRNENSISWKFCIP